MHKLLTILIILALVFQNTHTQQVNQDSQDPDFREFSENQQNPDARLDISKKVQLAYERCKERCMMQYKSEEEKEENDSSCEDLCSPLKNIGKGDSFEQMNIHQEMISKNREEMQKKFADRFAEIQKQHPDLKLPNFKMKSIEELQQEQNKIYDNLQQKKHDFENFQSKGNFRGSGPKQDESEETSKYSGRGLQSRSDLPKTLKDIQQQLDEKKKRMMERGSQNGNFKNSPQNQEDIRPSFDNAQYQECRAFSKELITDCVDLNSSAHYNIECIKEGLGKVSEVCLPRVCQLLSHLNLSIDSGLC